MRFYDVYSAGFKIIMTLEINGLYKNGRPRSIAWDDVNRGNLLINIKFLLAHFFQQIRVFK